MGGTAFKILLTIFAVMFYLINTQYWADNSADFSAALEGEG